MRRAFSYARFSKDEQRDGYSLTRQLDAAKNYCSRHGLKLDDRTFADLGVSGYHGGNAAGGDLGEFIGLVKDGRVPKGSVLIVENTDRLSRLPPDEASKIICGIVKAGIDIVTTSPEAVYTAANIGKLQTWLPLQVQQCLARDESEKKSDRLRDAWTRKRDELAKDKTILSKRAPSWLRLSADRKSWLVREDVAGAVRAAFGWSLEGHGVTEIAGLLNRDYPGGLKGKDWCPQYIRELLRSRTVLGEYQPHLGTCAKKGGVKKTRRPHGDPVKGYYPAILDETTFLLVQQALDGRRWGGGPVVGVPNLFRTVVNAVTGKPMVLNSNHGRKRLMVARKKGDPCMAVGYEEFEQSVLALLRELKASDVVGPKNGAQHELEAASAALTAVNHRIQQTQARVQGADDPDVFLDLLTQLAKDKKAAAARYERARTDAACEAADGLGETQTLIGLLKNAEGDELTELRRKARSALGRLVKEVWVLPVRRAKLLLLVAVQVFFRHKDGRRDYLLAVRRPGQWQAKSYAGSVGLDLRKPDHARRLEKALSEVPLARLDS